MTAQTNAPTVIIKKVKKVQGGGHHGGAWKVAYADFVTAMMAFFLLMWLLNATTEKQRKGIADYFSPTIPINRVSGGGEGSFNGDSVFTEETLAQTGIGGIPTKTESDEGVEAEALQEETQALEALEEMLTGRSGESMVDDGIMRHIVTEVTDEGLRIELFDIVGDPLFAAGGAEPTPVLRQLAEMMSDVFALVTNGVAISGYVRAEPVVLAEHETWQLSAARANAMRELIEAAGLAPERVQRVTGHADRKPVSSDPMAIRNNRIVLVLLRSDKRG